MPAYTVANSGYLNIGGGTVYADGVVAGDYATVVNGGSIGGAGVIAYKDVVITNSGAIDGLAAGVRANNLGVILTNQGVGTIRGVDGAVGAAGIIKTAPGGAYAGGGYDGHNGGDGADLNYGTVGNSGSLINYGAISGGKGGVGGTGASEPLGAHYIGGGRGGNGGAGGGGANTSGLFAINGGLIAGGDGGAGAQGGYGNGQSGDAIGGNGGAGGNGGVGLTGGYGRFINQPANTDPTAGAIHGVGTIVGGAGGDGAAGVSETNPGYSGGGGQGGNSGYGGVGVKFHNGEFDNFGAVIGGAGGAAGNSGHSTADSASGLGGNGAAGGYGVIAYTSGIINYGAITGGAGGAGGNRYDAKYGNGASGGRGGFGVAMLQSTLTNYGVITGGAGGAGGASYHTGPSGPSGAGVETVFGGAVINRGGTITGSVGVEDDAIPGGGLTVVNDGGLIGGTLASIIFNSSADHLTAMAGSVFTGEVVGGRGTLELGAGLGIILGLGGTGSLEGAVSAHFNGFGSYIIDAGGAWNDANGGTLTASQSLNVEAGGQLTVSGADLTLHGDLLDAGQINVSGASGFVRLVIASGGSLTGGGDVNLNLRGCVVVGGGQTLSNFDTISGGGIIAGPGSLVNEAGGVIDASNGRMVLNTAGTVINDGLIEATKGGVGFVSHLVRPSTVAILPGVLLVRNTTLDSSGGGTVFASSKIILDNATVIGGGLTIAVGGSLVTGAHGGTISLGGGAVSNAGIISGSGGGLTINGDVANTGLVQALNGHLTITGGLSGAGKARVFGSGVLEVDGALGENVFLAGGSTGALVLGDTAGFTGRVYGFSTTGANTIDLKDIAFDANDTTVYTGSAAGGTLSILDASNAVMATVKLTGNYLKSTFNLSDGGANGTVITDPPKTAALVSAMAGFGATGPASSGLAAHGTNPQTVLSLPH